MQLKTSTPSSARRTGARIVISALLAFSAMAGVVAQAETANRAPVQYKVAMTIDEAGHITAPQLLVRDGETFSVSSASSVPGAKPAQLSTEMKITDAGSGSVMVGMKVKVNGDMAAEPSIQLRLGETGTVVVDGYKMSLNVALNAPH